MQLSQSQIKNGWKVVRFKDFVALNRGFDLPIQDRVFGKYPVVASTSITDYHNEFKVKGPVVTTGRSGALGEVLYTAGDCWPLNTSLYSKNFYGNNSRFVYYKLKTLDLGKYNSGSGVPTLNKNHLDSIEIEIPEIKTQTKIAEVLSAYDDLIENNDKRIKVLEVMAQKLYTEWFVNFKFPGYEKVKMVDSGHPDFGMVPEGWEVKKVGDLIETLKRKKKIQVGEYLKDGTYPIIDQGKDFFAGFTNDIGTVYEEDLVVFGDHTRCFKYCNFKFACGADGTQLLKSNNFENVSQIYLYYIVINADLKNNHYARHFKFLKELDVLVATENLNKKFTEFVNQFYEQILNLQKENQNLKKSRDLLIPQLVGGRLLINE